MRRIFAVLQALPLVASDDRDNLKYGNVTLSRSS